MKNVSKTVTNQALELPALERAKLVEQLLCSLEQVDKNIDLVWIDEAEARIDAYDRGTIEAVSINEVFGKYDSN
ncbi:MAG: hypothetical protein DRR04_08055 [Gammaproteobacteria bacterium]|nr:MAG: hypothetical protein DRQ97_08810 [Gammaproteobacteria bacterium]RLA59594.1 MAG: hypothetical protein DRR04_08055 [Gammaproteobacteria bacterium]